MTPYIRIILRYVAGYLVAKGTVDMATAETLMDDPELIHALSQASEAVVGVVVGAVTETWYRLAEKYGWAK